MIAGIYWTFMTKSEQIETHPSNIIIATTKRPKNLTFRPTEHWEI